MNPIDVLSKISLSKIIGYLGSVVSFFVRPKRFFLDLTSKSDEDKFSQIIFYVLLYISLYIIFDEKENFNSVVKWLITTFLFNIFNLIVIVLSYLIVSSFFKINKIKLIDIIIYDLITLIFFELSVSLFDAGFKQYEADEYLLFSNMFNVYGFFYLFVVSQFVFFDQRKHTWAGILTMWLLANVADRVYPKIFSDEFTKSNGYGGLDYASDEFQLLNKFVITKDSINPAIIF